MLLKEDSGRSAENPSGRTWKFILTLCFSFCAFFLLSASGKAELPPENMIGLSIHYSPGRGPGSSFDLREEDGKTLFSCRFFREYREISLEKMPVDPEYMQRLRDMAKRHGFTQMRERDPVGEPFVRDAPMYGMTMYWPDNKSLRLNYWPARDEVERFFWEVAGACVYKPGAPEDISALYYDYAHVNETERFNFALRADQGKFLFSARYFTKDRDKVILRDVPVNSGHMQKLREIVKAHGIAAMQGEALPDLAMRRSAPPSPYTVLKLFWPDMRFVQLGQPASGGEELKQFFQELARDCSTHRGPTQAPELLEWLTFSCNRGNEADSFTFHLREVSASTQLMAQCFTKEGKKLEFDAAVNPSYMDQLRGIVKKHGIVNSLKKKPYSERERSINLNEPHCSLLIEWRDDPRLRTTEWPESGGEELEKFFRNLAQKYAN